MKKLFIIIFILITYFCFSENDFRNVKWGMSKEEVKKIETLPIIDDEEDILIYSLIMNNKQFYLLYFFTNDKLYQACYRLIENYTNDKVYLEDYKYFKNLLVEKYGEPSVYKEQIDSEYSSSLTTAILMGHATYASIWKDLDKIQITIGLLGDSDNMNLYLLIAFTNKKLNENNEQKEKERVKNNF